MGQKRIRNKRHRNATWIDLFQLSKEKLRQRNKAPHYDSISVPKEDLLGENLIQRGQVICFPALAAPWDAGQHEDRIEPHLSTH